MADGNQAIARMKAWNGKATTFESEIGASVDQVIEEVIETQTVATLYGAWSLLVDQRDLIRRGRALYLWDRVCDRRQGLSKKIKQWRHTERILFGTLTSIWSGLARLAPESIAKDNAGPPYDERIWLDSVVAALEETRDIKDCSAIENLHALLDLVARVFAMNGSGTLSHLTLWRGVVWREAMVLSRRAHCQEERPLAFPNATNEASEESTPLTDDGVRFILCLYADSITPIPDDKHPVEVLAARVASNQAAEWRGSRIKQTEPIAASKIERLLRHHASTNPLIAKLLHKRINYKPRSYRRSPKPIESVKRLSQEVLLLGRPSVGKSSFLFASETLCPPKESATSDPSTGMYPGIDLQHVSGDAGSLKSMRERWQGNHISQNDDFSMTAQTDPIGLCSFHFVDPPGEQVMGVGENTKRGRMYENVASAHIERLHPSILVMLLPPDPSDDSEVEALRHTLQELSRKCGTTTSLPIYLVVNKSDLLLEQLQEDGADDRLLAGLGEALNFNAFELGRYLEGAGTADTARRNLLDDLSLKDNVAVRELIARMFKKYESLMALLQQKKFLNVTLVFTCSLPVNDETKRRLGVNAFWKHLWISSCPLFSKALQYQGKQTFVENVKKNSTKIANLFSGPRINNLRLDKTVEAPGELERLLNNFKNLDMRKTVESVLHEFDATHSHNHKFEDKIRKLSRKIGCDYVMQYADNFESEIRRSSFTWEDLLYRLIGELNIWPNQECNEFVPDKLNPQQIKWLQDDLSQAVDSARSMAEEKSLHERHIHGYYGALRDSSVRRNPYGNNGSSSDAGKWLAKGGNASIKRHVQNTINHTKTDVESMMKVLSDVFWLISDYGFDDEKKRETSSPDYTYFTVRRWDTDWFRLRSLLAIQPEDRIKRVISLIEMLVNLHLHNLSKLETQIRGVLMGFVIAHILNKLGFNVESIEEDTEGFISDVDSLLRTLFPIHNEISTFPFRLKSLIGKKGDFRVKIQTLNLEGTLNKYTRQGSIFIGTKAADVKRMLALLSFARLAVQICETAKYRLLTDSSEAVSEILITQAHFTDACKDYNEGVREYVDTTLKLFMRGHQEYLEAAGFLSLVSTGQRSALSRAIESPFRANAVVGDVQIEEDWRKWIEEVAEQFSKIIDALDETSV